MNTIANQSKIKMYFLIVVFLQTAILLFMIGAKQYTLNAGTPILLETQPIDPRSLFSGDYVSLNYAINTLDLLHIPGDRDFKIGDKIYVTLQSGISFWEPITISKTKGDSKPGQVIIQGIITGANGLQNTVNLFVVYGIEQYFVPEGEGKELERLANNKQLSVIVKVDQCGHAAIAGLTALGQAIYQEKLF